jgi:general secretion pathway protein M
MKLSRREKTAVLAACCFIGIFFMFKFALFPLIDQKEKLKRTLAVGQKDLEEIRLLKREYLTFKNEADISKIRFQKRHKGFTLFSFLDGLAGEVGIKERIVYMKPSSTAQKDSAYKITLVEMKLNGISLDQITQFLYKIETSQNMVIVKRLSLTKSGEKKQSLSAILQVQTYEV